MKRYFAFTLAMILLAAFMTSCNSKSSSEGNLSSTGASSGSASSAETTVENGVTNVTGYPITNDKITLEAAIIYGAHKGDFEKYDYWNKVTEQTNIEIKLRVLNSSENVNLMYTSRDFPDFSFSTGVGAQQFTDAVDAGDIIQLDDYLESYAQTYTSFFEANPDMKALCREADGGVYSLPFVNLAEWDYNMRDIWLINGDWLEELKMEIPTTLDEFTAYLRAVKSAAGTGTIPSNVIPYYFLHNQRIGGPFEIFASFGLPTGTVNGMGIYIQDGKVVNNATNEAIKEPIKYLKMLYSEELISPEAFTDNWDTYVAKLKAEPAVVGSVASYSNNNISYWENMPLLDTGTGATPILRFQQKSCTARQFVIFKGNEYPIATLRLGDMFGDPDWSVYTNWGAEGEGYSKTAEGEYRKIQDVGLQDDQTKWVPGNYGLAVLTEEMNNQLSTDTINDPRSREYAYFNLYKQFLPPENISVYPKMPSGYITEEESDKLTQIDTDTQTYINKMFANWITGASDIDADWDEYLNQLDKLGLPELLEIRQKAYDAYLADLN